MAKTITHQVPPIQMSIDTYLYYKSIKRNAAWSAANGYLINGHQLTKEKVEKLFPTTNIKIIYNKHFSLDARLINKCNTVGKITDLKHDTE